MTQRRTLKAVNPLSSRKVTLTKNETCLTQQLLQLLLKAVVKWANNQDTELRNITVQLHLPGLIVTAKRPEMPKVRIIGFFFENRLYSSLNFGCYYLQYVPTSKPSDHA
jgi:hypothetical protein